MTAAPYQQRGIGLAIGAAIVGAIVCWATGTLFGILAPILALFLYLHVRAIDLLNIVLTLLFVGLVAYVIVQDSEARSDLAHLPATIALALCAGLLLRANLQSPSKMATASAGGRAASHQAPPPVGKVQSSEGSPLDAIHPDDRAAVTQAAAYAFWTGVTQVIDCRQLQTDGSFILTTFRADPGYGVGVDVDPMVTKPNEPWTTTDAIGETGEAVRAAKIIEALHGKAWAFDANGQFTYVTPAAQTAIGMTLQALNAPVRGGAFIDGGDAGWSLGVHPDDYERAATGLRHSLKTGDHWNVEYRMLRTTGQYVWHRISARPTRNTEGRITGWYGTSIDIDVYKKTEAALRKSECELSELVNMVPIPLWRLSPQGEPTFFNKRLIDYIGLDVGSFDSPGAGRLASAISTLVHPDDSLRVAEAYKHSFATGETYALRYRLRRADGIYRWVEGRAEPMRDDAGRIVHWYGLVNDIDDQIRADEALRHSQRHLQQLIETLPAMIDCAAPNGEPIYRSQQLRDFLGYNLNVLDHTGISRLDGTLDAGVHPEDLANVKEDYSRSLSTGIPYARRHRLRRSDGEYRWVETRAAAMRDAEGNIVQWNVICLDIDGEVRAQEALLRAQDRLARATQAASLAELSASIAHEVNQPLAAIVANSHAGLRWLTAEPPNIERAKLTVDRIIRDANSAADVVGRIRALFKQTNEARILVEIGAVVAEARQLMADEGTRRGVQIKVYVERNLPPITIDRIQIQQVLVNLIRNGMEAMDSIVGEKVVIARVSRAENLIRIKVSDAGSGIVHPDRIFDPFFSTKHDGMGMGLAICRSIIESHGGRLWAEKNEPQGSSFIFTLPVEAQTPS